MIFFIPVVIQGFDTKSCVFHSCLSRQGGMGIIVKYEKQK